MGEKMKKIKNSISVLLSFLLIFNMINLGETDTFAQSAKVVSKMISIGNSSNELEVIEKSDGEIVNPLYEGLEIKTYSPKSRSSATKVFTTKKDAANYLKEEMVKRRGTIAFTVKVKSYDNLYKDLFAMAVEDDENADSSEGDYLFRHWSSYYVEWDDSKSTQTDFVFDMKYLSTYKQEQEVNYEVKKVLDELDVYNEDDYTKAKAVHDFITENITYDYNLKKYSAYDGIVSKNVVCNGYSALTYKMMKDLGVGVRCITGNKSTEYHAWNIGRIDDKWYNIDNTWDATESENSYVVYDYFLKNNAEFSAHIRDDEFKSDTFNKAYPMSKTSYKDKDYYNTTFALNKTQKTIGVGKTFKLYGIKMDENDKIKSFTSSNENVATVSSSGEVKGISLGQTTITCETENGNIATCRIKIRYDISSGTVSKISNGEKFVYNGSAKKPSVTFIYNGKTLEEGVDYALDYGSNTLSGQGSITVVGIGDYTGTKKATFKIYPSKVTNQKVSSTTPTSIKISWSKENGVTGYQIYRSTSKDGKYSKVGTVSSKYNTYTNSNLISGTTYYYKIRAYKTVNNENLYGDYSNILTGKTKYPGQVKNLKQNSSYTNSVKLSWSKASYASGYRVYRATSKDGTYKRIAELSGSSKTTYTDKNLSSGKTYYYKVRAYRKVGSSRDYGSYSTKLKASTKCNTPVITLSSKNKNQSKISWKKISGASGYVFYRSTSKTGTFTKVQTVKSGSTLSVTDTNLKSGKTYYYKVRAYRSADIGTVYSSYSSVKSIKIK